MAAKLRLSNQVVLSAASVQSFGKGLEHLILTLAHVPTDAAPSIHDSRKLIKRLRATLRLLKPWLPKKELRQLAHDLKTLSARLSPNRDADVMMLTWDALFARHSNELGNVDDNVRDALKTAREKLGAGRLERDVWKGIRNTSAWRPYVAQWTLAGLTRRKLSSRLNLIGNKARQSWAAALLQPSSDAFHSARKQHKDWLYSLNFLEHLTPPASRKLALALEAFTETLGQYNDLDVLANYLQDTARDEAEQATTLALIVYQKRRLLLEAERLANELKPLTKNASTLLPVNTKKGTKRLSVTAK